MRIRVRTGIRIRASLWSELQSDSELGGKQEANIPSPFIIASPVSGNLGTKLSTTDRHNHCQSSCSTLREGTTGTGPWRGLEV